MRWTTAPSRCSCTPAGRRICGSKISSSAYLDVARVNTSRTVGPRPCRNAQLAFQPTLNQEDQNNGSKNELLAGQKTAVALQADRKRPNSVFARRQPDRVGSMAGPMEGGFAEPRQLPTDSPDQPTGRRLQLQGAALIPPTPRTLAQDPASSFMRSICFTRNAMSENGSPPKRAQYTLHFLSMRMVECSSISSKSS